MADQVVSTRLRLDASDARREAESTARVFDTLAGRATTAGQRIDRSFSGLVGSVSDVEGEIRGLDSRLDQLSGRDRSVFLRANIGQAEQGIREIDRLLTDPTLTDAEIRIALDKRNEVTSKLDEMKGDLADIEAEVGDIDRAGVAATGTLAKMAGRLDAAGAKMQRYGTMATAGVTVPLMALADASLDASSDLEEATSKTEQLFGRSADSIVAWAETADTSMGMSQRAALDSVGSIGAMLDAMGFVPQVGADMSMTMAQLAGDMASFNNEDPSEMLDKLRSGLSGEAEPLKRFGVLLTAAAVEAKAMEMGLADANGEIDEAAKVQARYQIILDQTAAAQGDFDRTSEGMANSQRIVTAQWENARAELGEHLMPIASDFLGVLSAMVEWFGDLDPAAQKVVVVMGGIAAAAGPAALVIGSVLRAVSALSDVSPTAAGRLRTVAGGLGRITAGAAAYYAAAAGISAIGEGLADLAGWGGMDLSNLAAELELLARTGESGNINTGRIALAIDEIIDPSFWESAGGTISRGITMVGNVLSLGQLDLKGTAHQYERELGAIDDALVAMVEGDNADQAAEVFSQISDAIAASGHDASLAAEAFPDYSTALELTAARAGDAGVTLFGLAASTADAIFGMGAFGGATDDTTGSIVDQEEAMALLGDRLSRIGDMFAEFTDAQTAWDDVIAKNQEWAESVAASTGSAEDSWEDYYDGFSVSTEQWIDEMQAQMEAQQEWKENVVAVAQAGRQDVADILAQMGPEGAELAARFAELTGAEFQTAADLFVATMSDGGQEAGEALAYEMAVMAEIARTGGEATAQAIVDAVGGKVSEVAQIAAHYGVVLADGVNPVLRGLGLRDIQVAAQMRGARTAGPQLRNAGGMIDGVGDTDSVPAMLTPGEFVIRKPAVRAIGLDTLHRLNQADRVQRFAAGGFVSASDVPAPPSMAGYGNIVGYAGGQVMDHLYEAVRKWIGANAIPSASGSATGLDPAFLGMFNRYNEVLGGILRITSGFRSRAKQAQLYASYLAGTGNLAAPPGRSNHERGLAIDHAPNSTAAMRATARGIGLHYPVRGEPWHVEPIHIRDAGGPLMPGLSWNGTGRPEVVLPVDPQRFADGGLVGSTTTTVNARLGAEGAGRHHARFLYEPEDLDRIGSAYADLVQQVDEATAWLLLQQDLTVDGYQMAARDIIEAVKERAEAEEEALDRARAAQDIAYDEGALAADRYTDILAGRHQEAAETFGYWSAEAHQVRDEIRRVLDDIDRAEKEVADKRQRRTEEQQRIRDDAFDHLNDLLDREQALRRQMADATAEHHQRLRELDRQLDDDRAAAIDDRAAQLEGWASIEERAVVRWGNTVSALTRNVRDQLDQFVEWQDQLSAARARGVSEDVIEMLGLGSGPEALGQLRMFASATDEEIAVLNDAVQDRQRQATDRAEWESTRSYTALGGALMAMQERYAAEHEALVEQFLAEQRELSDQLAAIGMDQGRDYGTAVEEGLRSTIPGIRAAAAEARQAMADLEAVKNTGAGMLVNTETGRAAFTGPAGEGGYATRPAGVAGAVSWRMPDGRTAWYVPGEKIQPGNLGALAGYAEGTASVPQTGLYELHQGERVLSQVDNRALVGAVQHVAAAAPVVNVGVTLDVDSMTATIRTEVDGHIREQVRAVQISGSRGS